MTSYPLFLSVVYVVRNQAALLPELVSRAVEQLATLVSDYELVVIDNGSSDDSVAVLKRLTGQDGAPNL